MEKAKSLLLEHRFKATPDAVFDAWINPAVAKQWFFKSDTNEILSIKMDARQGGRFSILELNNGTEIDHFGIYLEIDRPGRLVFTLEVPKHVQGVARIEIDIIREGENTKLIFKESEVDTTDVKKNWVEMLNKLEEILQRNTSDN